MWIAVLKKQSVPSSEAVRYVQDLFQIEMEILCVSLKTFFNALHAAFDPWINLRVPKP